MTTEVALESRLEGSAESIFEASDEEILRESEERGRKRGVNGVTVHPEPEERNVGAAIHALDTPELLFLGWYARGRIGKLNLAAAGRTSENLLREAIIETTSKTIRLRPSVGLCVYLLRAMRSISSRWREDLLQPSGKLQRQ